MSNHTLGAEVTGMSGFQQWLKDNSYAILLAGLILAMDWGVIQYRINTYDAKIETVTKVVTENTAKIQSIQILAAGEAAKTAQAIKNIEKTQERILDLLETMNTKKD